MMKQDKKASTQDISLLLQRVLTAAAFIFFTIGQTLHFNAFVQNAIDLGLPYPQLLCAMLIAISFICSALVLIGLSFRAASFVLFVIAMCGGAVFFAGEFNKVNVVSAVLALALLGGFTASGAGAVSLDSYLNNKKEKKTKKRLPIH